MMHQRARPLAPLAASLLLLLAACAGNTPPRMAAPACLGQIRLTVTNDWNQPVEIHRADASPSPTLLGYVSAGGRQELVLPQGVRSVYTLASDGTVARAIPRQYRRLVRYSYACES